MRWILRDLRPRHRIKQSFLRLSFRIWEEQWFGAAFVFCSESFRLFLRAVHWRSVTTVLSCYVKLPKGSLGGGLPLPPFRIVFMLPRGWIWVPRSLKTWVTSCITMFGWLQVASTLTNRYLQHHMGWMSRKSLVVNMTFCKIKTKQNTI